MSSTLLGLVALVYAYVAYDYWQRGSPGLALAFLAYAAANAGFIWDLTRS